MLSGVCFDVSLLLSPAPPLTLVNIMKSVEGVKDWKQLGVWLNGGIFSTDYSIKDVVERFLQGRDHYQPSWRAVIWVLDMAGKTRLANHIRSYGEPVQGVRVCVCECECE